MQSLFKIVSTVFLLSGPITHRSFSRILPDSYNFFGSIPKFFSKFDLRMNYHQSCLSPRSFKFFSLLVQPFQFSFRSASIILDGVSHRHSHHLKTEEEFLLNPYPFFQRCVVQAWCHPLIIVFDCENSFQPSGVIQSIFSLIIRSPSSKIYSFSVCSYHSPILPVHRSSDL